MNITLDHITKHFGSQTVLETINRTFSFSHTLALVGPSGGGKSTLLRLLAGLEYPDAGSISVDGDTLEYGERWLLNYRRRIGVVFQAYNLFPHLTALQNVMLPLKVAHGHSVSDASDRAHATLARFQLEAHADKKPSQLSGGQRQRVAIARALAISPKFLLLDEPTSALDPEMTGEVLDVIAELRGSDIPVVLVTHEMGFARKTADLVAFVAEGGVLECSQPEAFFNDPKTLPAQRFLERILKY